MSKTPVKIVLTSLSPTITSVHTQDQIFKTLIQQKLKNKTLSSSEVIEITVFGKKCGFRIEEVALKSGEYKGEKLGVTEDTSIEVFPEGEYKKSQNLSASLKKALFDELEDEDIGDSVSQDEEEAKVDKMAEKALLCDEVGFEQVDELEQVLKFNLSDQIEENLKLRNVVVCGPEKSGKKTIVQRAVKNYWEYASQLKSQKSADIEKIKLQDLFAFKTLSITKEPVNAQFYLVVDTIEIRPCLSQSSIVFYPVS